MGKVDGLRRRRCVGKGAKGANEFELLKLGSGLRTTAAASGRRRRSLLQDDLEGSAVEELWAGEGDAGGDGVGGEDASCVLAAEGWLGERHVAACR